MASGQVPYWVWVVLVGMHALALSWALHQGTWDFPDSGRYVQAAENLWLHGELYARPWPVNPPIGQAVQEFTIRPLAYPVVVLAVGGTASKPVLLLVLQNVLSLLNIGVVLQWWVRRCKPRSREWRLAVMIILLTPAQFIYASAVMSEVVLQTLVVGMVGAGLLFIDTRQKRYFTGVIMGVVGALLLKPVFYPLVGLVAAVGMLMAWRRQQLSIALLGVVPLLVVGLYMEWNFQRTGYVHFSSIAEINLLHYNAAGVVRQLKGLQAEEEWITGVLKAADTQPNFAARQRLIQARAGAMLWAHPIVYARQHLQGIIAFFLDPGRFDISQFLGLAAPAGGGLLAQVRAGGLWRAVTHLPLGLLSGLGVLLLANGVRLVLAMRGVWLLRNGTPMLRYGRWVAVGLLLYVAVLTGPLGAARFLVPVWPLLLGLALVGLQRRADLKTSDA